MKLLYAGFDTVDVAFQGAFPVETIDLLKNARDLAAEREDGAAVLAHIGTGRVPIHVHPGGLKGGYAIRTDTGPLGEVLAFKANTDTREWNAFASIRAASLAAYGYPGARDRLFERLCRMGFLVTGHSVNRIDYAADFLAPAFELRLDGFVAHARTKVRPHWSVQASSDLNQPSAVLTGRRLESVTIGKMPGRQIIVYDKRRAAIAQRKLFWFTVWNLSRNEPAEVYRIEVRAGKKELKEHWGIRTFDDVDRAIGDVVRYALDEVRYVAASQGDSNVTRQCLDPIWQAMIAQVEAGLFDQRAGLLPSRIREVERQLAIDTYSALVLGNIAGLAVAEDVPPEEIETALYEKVRQLLVGAINDPRGRFYRSIDRARERLYFVCNSAA
jgi:hypothetical protein